MTDQSATTAGSPADHFDVPATEVIAARSKVVSWQDPLALAAAGRTLSGLDFLRKMARRELPAPPIAELFGFEIDSVEPGDVVFRCAPDESTYNPIGVVHGGTACVMLDTVAGCACTVPWRPALATHPWKSRSITFARSMPALC